MEKKKLGLGLEALLGAPGQVSISPTSNTPSRGRDVADLDVGEIRANPYQPRTTFDEEDLRSLADSLKRSGLIQPIVVRRSTPGYELVAGERRYRAAKLAGLSTIPAVIRDVDEKGMLVLALVENLQRKDLNAIEKAKAVRQLMTMNTWTQDQAAESLGLGRPTVANLLRLLELPPEVQEAVAKGAVSMGHARALLATSNGTVQRQLLKRILSDDLSVRAVERHLAAQPGARAKSSSRKDPHIEDLERRFSEFFGTRVQITTRKKGGQIVIDWFGNDQFNGILKRLGV